jgi:hypothetical protein
MKNLALKGGAYCHPDAAIPGAGKAEKGRIRLVWN